MSKVAIRQLCFKGISVNIQELKCLTFVVPKTMESNVDGLLENVVSLRNV